MVRAFFTILLSGGLLLAASGCSCPHVFPRTKPLFVGLDESHMTPTARIKLNKAKTDFACARSCGIPCYAKEASRVPHTRSRRFVGDGYEITIVDAWAGFVHRTGPEITISPGITGAGHYRYEEIEACND